MLNCGCTWATRVYCASAAVRVALAQRHIGLQAHGQHVVGAQVQQRLQGVLGFVPAAAVQRQQRLVGTQAQVQRVGLARGASALAAASKSPRIIKRQGLGVAHVGAVGRRTQAHAGTARAQRASQSRSGV
jgi:hypothetical protein